MRCEDVRALLVAYHDGEIAPAERNVLEAHLIRCAGCRDELAALTALQSHIGRSLHQRVAHVAPLPDAWDRLQRRLVGEARPRPRWLRVTVERPGSGVRQSGHSIGIGGVTMNVKRLGLSGLAVAVLVAGVFAFTNVGSGNSTAYAKEIAQKSYEVASSWTPQQEQAAERAFGVDPRTLLQEALSANDLKMLTYDELVRQSPDAVPPLTDETADLRNLKFLQFTKDGAKVVVGIDQTNLPVFMGQSERWSAIPHHAPPPAGNQK
jgi:anti-sigma factor RsiW